MNSLLGKKIGILGGGQLARMLALKAHELGLEVHVLSESTDDPAAQVVRHFTKGSPDKITDVESFAKNLDLLTFESEFIPAANLKKLETFQKLHIFPNLQVLSILQDRLTQKRAFQAAHLPTAEFIEIQQLSDCQRAYELFKGKLVFKKRFGGYDGNETHLVQNQKDLLNFIKKYSDQITHYLAEELIPFKKECAFAMARSASGEMVTLPLVEVRSFEKKCDVVSGPIQHPAWNRLIAHCAHFLEDLNYEGLCSFELFDTGKKLIVNETAPRVHNTGHYSLNALNIDQFSLHLKSGSNQALYEVKCLTPAFVMTNLLGTSQQTPQIPELLTGQLHWYGKKQNRPGRKMGHVNYCGKNTVSLLRQALRERDDFKHLGPQKRKQK